MLLEDLGWEGSSTAPLVNSPWMRYYYLSLRKPANGLKVDIQLADQALLQALLAHERLTAHSGQRYSAQM